LLKSTKEVPVVIYYGSNCLLRIVIVI